MTLATLEQIKPKRPGDVEFDEKLRSRHATIAVIGPGGEKTFIPFPDSMERDVQFGFAALPDGTLSVTYPPVNRNTLTWNEVYTRSYFNGAWSPPALVGYNYGDYSKWDGSGHGDPGFLISRADRAEVGFQTPDTSIHTFMLSDSAPPPADLAAPTTSIMSPSAPIATADLRRALASA